MSCDEFLEWIKSDFDYLFEDYHFKVIYTYKAVTREDHCLVILESPYCRVKFDRSYEAAGVMFGSLSAPLTGEHGKGDIQSWFYIRFLLDFVSKRKPDFESLFKNVAFSPVRQQLKEQSEALKPLCSKVMLLFQPSDLQDVESSFADFVQWRRELEREIVEYMQRKSSGAVSRHSGKGEG